MKIFLDTCDIDIIKRYHEKGFVDGVTTNPFIIAHSGLSVLQAVRAICEIIKTSISVEVISAEIEEMIEEAVEYHKLGEQITIKLPLTKEGLIVCKKLSSKGISVNMTLCFSPSQAILAARMGADYVSPLIGRLDDIGQSGLKLIADICEIYSNYPSIKTQIIAASVRNNEHFIESAKSGADIATISPNLLNNLINHDLTKKGLEIFMNDRKNSRQN
ncbi:MAG: Fructose-6-phosphate aldolase [Candidatus Midichloria mitochondrii]|uniref:Fructose-6-phosphate aldolase n=1 Tax=Midichloria mitochondrii (strain IricVA) TaxID=696127 RepID=F7XUI2_MIDMI|nr:transaldolase family protein [Candidatus Midichloria mitochondrii]AEI88331.1 fructose-6-phosphate aldolase [Candidatus Midichloria mitochondrii IricVA]MDJ1256285.1 fructose-6-phosphate aldolase [Candidatus Midichloria mitochondrii]MDJ1288337.1 fructose-6-phosphate aldolase [Candidatus Midichloria mitochondrii]MDJ1298827.1 fructose-6-phosphate aldolase [Candidatus Midichloria mitochondrii]MDJ1313032.1 fructose-6-phosphate aldolase [Candidatus Midichloria mitochondrii]